MPEPLPHSDPRPRASMPARYKALILSIVLLCGGAAIFLFARRGSLGVLDPRGLISAQERDLMFIAIGLMLLVVIPVFILTISIAIRYRAGNAKAAYEPELDHNALEEFIWWAIPCAIIFVLAIITWNSTHALDPYRPLSSSVSPITIEVVALDWKWLFIYPAQGIASVNEVEFPSGTPVNFEITADAPMNSFWIPQLGGQIYAMSGMVTRLHLEADAPGSYQGASSNFSGSGFADMTFTANAVSDQAFAAWVESIKQSAPALSQDAYAALAKPSTAEAPSYYGSVAPGLYTDTVMKYMMPAMASSSATAMPPMPGMAMPMSN